MALNTRGLDPRFAFAVRPVVRNFMLVTGVLRRLVPIDPVDSSWVPGSTPPAAPANFLPLYEGPARVQPQLGWRGRAINWRNETVTDQLTRIQLDFRQNRLNGGELPNIHVDDQFKVTEVLLLDGVPVDPQLLELTFTVMNVSFNSNSWVRTIFCDTVML